MRRSGEKGIQAKRGQILINSSAIYIVLKNSKLKGGINWTWVKVFNLNARTILMNLRTIITPPREQVQETTLPKSAKVIG
jgi:hypothetical protein